MTRRVLQFSVAAEGATGVVVALQPSLVARWLFASDLAGAGATFARLLGITLVALAIACWPRGAARRAAVHGMFAYNLLAALYLAWLGAARPPAGILLWPAVGEHALVALLLAIRTGDEGVSA